MFTQMRSNLKFLGSILFALVFLMGGILTVKSAQAATVATVASQVDQYTQTGNDGNFTRLSTASTDSTVSHTTNPDGSVVVNINNATGYADSGFYTKTMKLGDVKSVTVTGSGSYGVNIWLDTNTGNDPGTNGKFFTWNSNGNVWVSNDGDVYFSEGSSVPDNGTLTINDSSRFHSYTEDVIPYSAFNTLAELKALYSDKYITFWVGTTAMNGGTQSATISTFDVVAPGELAATDFGVWNTSGVIGYSAGFGFTDATLADATSIVVKLYSGTTLLQTNTATANLATTYPTSPIFSAPFDVFGTFNYGTDGNWTNVRGSEYGQTLTPTEVVATVTLANGKEVTATSTNPPTGELTIISNARAAASAAALTNAKIAAKGVLTTALATYTQGNYTAENWTILTGFKSAGDTAIDVAGNTNAITSAQNTATTEMSGVAVINRSHSSGSRAATPAIPATPAVPGISPAIPATPAVPAGKVLGAEKFNFTKFLKFKAGSYKVSLQGTEVIELQKFLATLGYDIGIADGKFGSKTNAAVIKFQIANGLKGDGVIGALTRAILNK